MSPELQQFYNCIDLWVDKGCPEDEILSKEVGLCANLNTWLSKLYPDRCRAELNKIVDEQYELFWQQSGASYYLYPFNFGSNMTYHDERRLGLTYKNEKRLNWIKSHANRD